MLKSQDLSFNIFTVNLMIILSLVPLFDGGFDHDIVYYMLILSLISLLGYSFKYKKVIKVSKLNPIIYLSLFIIWSGLSFVWSVHYTRTLIEFLQITLYGIVFIMTIKLDSENKEKIKSIVILMGTLIGLLGILEYIIISTGRIVGSFTNPNPFATYLIMIFLYTWALTLRQKTKSMYIASTILFIAILLTGSRGGFIALILSIAFLFIGLNRKDLFKAITNTIILILFSLLLTKGIMVLAPIVQENLGLNRNLLESLLRKNSFLSSSLVGRLEFWKVAGKVAGTKPLIGYGLGTFFTSYYLGYAGNKWFSRFTHNHYLQMLAEIGTVGLILFLLFISICFYHIYKRLKSKDYPIYLPGSISGVVFFLIHIGMEFSFNFPGVTVIFFYLMAISIGDIDEQCFLANIEEGKIFSLNHRFKYLIYIPLLLITFFHLSSLYLYEYSAKLINDEEILKANKVLTLTNTYYPINPIGYAFKSENYKTLYKESNDMEDLDLAIDNMKKAIKRAPMDGNLYNKLGNLYLEKKDYINAEKNLVLGVQYGIYPLNRYIDLGNFYINQNNYIKAEEVLLKGEKISPYAISSAGIGGKEMAVFNTSIIHTRLYYIYKQEKREVLMEKQVENIIEISDDYDVLREYFLNIMESY